MDPRAIDLLRRARHIAVVGISEKPDRPSHYVAKYLQEAGYRIIPINPKASEILGERVYPTLTAYGKPVDIVDIFRLPEAVPPIVEEAIATGASCVWMQQGIAHPEAASRAEAAGLIAVQDACIKMVLMELGGRT